MARRLFALSAASFAAGTLKITARPFSTPANFRPADNDFMSHLPQRPGEDEEVEPVPPPAVAAAHPARRPQVDGKLDHQEDDYDVLTNHEQLKVVVVRRWPLLAHAEVDEVRKVELLVELEQVHDEGLQEALRECANRDAPKRDTSHHETRLITPPSAMSSSP
eukprot:8174271-Heterocapsa_arctica.AAC.1